MKLAFTTLGCPNWDMKTIAAKARHYGYDGVDFRCYMGHLDLSKLSEFTTHVSETAQILSDEGLKVPCLSSSARLYAKTKEERDGFLAEVRAYSEICEALDCPRLRVFGGDFQGTPEAEVVWIAKEELARMADAASTHGVTVLVETHDDWVKSQLVRDLMESTDAENVGVLWDVHHPYRLLGEQPADTWKHIGPWVQYIHVKDSKAIIAATGAASFAFTLVGEGDIPLQDIFHCLKKGGYDGWLTLEWEKKWHPDIPEPEVAFPQFVKAVRPLWNA